jgi:3D (Asp-Asp-Asp) domain-containing protein
MKTTLILVTFNLIIIVFYLFRVEYNIKRFNNILLTQNKINAELRTDINELKKKRKANVTVTAYSPRERETDSTPYTTAFMQPVSNRTIALPWHLIKDGWTPNSCLYLDHPVPLYRGLYKINDVMNRRHKDRADVFLFDTQEAINFGAWENVDMIYLGECP